MGRWRTSRRVPFVAFALQIMLVWTAGARGPVARVSTAGAAREGTVKIARNVIVLIADGGGYNHVDAASIYESGTTRTRVYEAFPYRYAASTYSADGIGYDTEAAWADFEWRKSHTTDSAAAATALSTGYKTHNGSIGVDVHGYPLVHLVEHAKALGKSSGVVTSV